MKGTKFLKCQLIEVDFTEADLSGSVFDACDLSGAQFGGANLERADLRNAERFMIDPAKTKVKKAKFRLQGLSGLLGAYDLFIEP